MRTRACSGTFIARTKQVALTHNVRGKELITVCKVFTYSVTLYPAASFHFSNSLAINICVNRNRSPGSTEGALLIFGLFISFVRNKQR